MPGRTYEQSSESGRERMLPIPYARLEHTTPLLHDPAAVLSLLAGTQITGMVINLDTIQSVALLNVARGAVYRCNVRNVRTYNAGAENTWGVVNIGNPVYYDRSNTMPGTCFLSTSPADRLAAANPLYGWVVCAQDETAASFPLAPTGAATTLVDVAIQLA